jgi:hypothetical protein
MLAIRKSHKYRIQYGANALRKRRVNKKLRLLRQLNRAQAEGDTQTVNLLKEILRW